MRRMMSSPYLNFVEGDFAGKANVLSKKYGNFDFVWFDCGGSAEYKAFIDEYWDLCSHYVFFHFTYSNGTPNEIHEIIRNKVRGNTTTFDIVEPHKQRQGSITIVKKESFVSSGVAKSTI